MRRLSTSQAANSKYRLLRLISAVISTNSASTKMPPSSSPDRRWNSCTEACSSALSHSTAVSRAGPTELTLQTRPPARAGASSSRVNPALAGLIWCKAPDRSAWPSGARLRAFQQLSAIACLEGNSTASWPKAEPSVGGRTIQNGSSDSWVSRNPTAAWPRTASRA